MAAYRRISGRGLQFADLRGKLGEASLARASAQAARLLPKR